MEEKHYIIENKELMEEWDWEKNNKLNIFPDKLSYGSDKKVWWLIHYFDKNTKKVFNLSWSASISHRVGGRKCPYISNPIKKILVGFNDLATTNPKEAEEWAEKENIEKYNLKIEDVTYGSTKIAVWKCKIHGLYETKISDKCKGGGCPYCSGKKILIGFNDLATTEPELTKEWDWEKNKITPQEITRGSTKKVWWKCSLSHEYLATPNARTSSKTGCPYCSSKKILIGFNDLATTNPKIASEWDYDKNYPLKPTDIMKNSNKKVWWKCKKGHSFYSYIYARSATQGCPICSHQQLLTGFNDLQTNFPNLIKEWNYEKNNELKIFPDKVFPSDRRKVYWNCPNGHIYKTSIMSRAKSNTNCPICSKPKQISLPEKAIAFYLSKFFDIEENKKIQELNSNSELDIFIPKYNLAIEYDGLKWHNNIARDKKKDDYCFNNGITLIRIREYGLKDYFSPAYFIKLNKKVRNNDTLNEILQNVFNEIASILGLPLKYTFDIKNDFAEIIKQIKINKVKNSVASNQKLLQQWDWVKNNGVNPENILLGTHDKYWWICDKGHSTYVSVYSRKKCGCKYCSNQALLTGFNDLKTLRPDLAKEFDCNKNGVKPNAIIIGSNKKYWWKCSKCGFEWEATVSHRCSGENCSKCSRQNTIKSHYKKVINIDTNEIFNSIKEASQKYGIFAGCISDNCRGRNKSAGGYHWKFFDNKKEK